jgi:hypothetical protein
LPDASGFQDLQKNVPGTDYIKATDRELVVCDAVLVLIGLRWLGANQQTGKPRLFDPADLVRDEVATAFRFDRLVVPVLLGGAEMPKAGELPDDVKHLCSLHAIRLTEEHRDGGA